MPYVTGDKNSFLVIMLFLHGALQI